MRKPSLTAFFAMILIAALLSACVGETGKEAAPTPAPAWDQAYMEAIVSAALPVLNAICSLDGLHTFEGAPDQPVALGAARAYLASNGGEDGAWAIKQLFKAGEIAPIDGGAEVAPLSSLPCAVTVEAVTDSGAGTVIASVSVALDYGYGMEFAYLCDIHVVPDPEAAFGATVARVFFPE